jgi:hypothetical protein
MQSIGKIARLFVITLVVLWLGPKTCFSTVAPDEIGVRQSNFSGVLEDDVGPGWVLRVPGVHKIIRLPRKFSFLDYTDDDTGPQSPLQIRTQDNNIVHVDVSVPFHIKEGEGFEVVKAGNHVEDRDDLPRFQRLAEETTVSVLRERLAELTSSEWYDTERRLAVATSSLERLNESLAELHVEAEWVLIRSVTFRPEYEQQLQQIQLNEQNKLLDGSRERVAKKEQILDNYTQGTNALASSREQEWLARLATLDRAYQVGFLELPEDMSPGAARRELDGLDEAARQELGKAAAEALTIDPSEVNDQYLMGIKNIEAETLEYDQRTRLEADGISNRLRAEGAAELATVRGEFETRINELLNSAAGRAFVAYEAADNIKFDETLVFRSSDGVPSVLRLRKFTEEFMGER